MELTNEQLQEIANIVMNKLAKNDLVISQKASEIKISYPDKALDNSYNQTFSGSGDNVAGDKTPRNYYGNNETLILSSELNKIIENLSKETNQNPEQILRKAIALIKIAIYSSLRVIEVQLKLILRFHTLTSSIV